MDIERDLAIQILKYCDQHPYFIFPFLVMCKEYSDEDDDFVEIEPEEWQTIKADKKYRTFELWENLQNLDLDTTELMAQGFIEKITKDSVRKIQFTITEDEVREVAEQKLSSKQVQSILDAIECAEMLWKDIHNSIVYEINLEIEESGGKIVNKI